MNWGNETPMSNLTEDYGEREMGSYKRDRDQKPNLSFPIGGKREHWERGYNTHNNYYDTRIAYIGDWDNKLDTIYINYMNFYSMQIKGTNIYIYIYYRANPRE